MFDVSLRNWGTGLWSGLVNHRSFEPKDLRTNPRIHPKMKSLGGASGGIAGFPWICLDENFILNEIRNYNNVNWTDKVNNWGQMKGINYIIT